MPTPRIYEKKSSRALQLATDSQSMTLEFRIQNQPSHGAAEELLLATAPVGILLTYERTIARKSWSLVPAGGAKDDVWDCVVEYGSPNPSQNEYLISGSISAETVHITQALETVARYTIEGREPIDYQGAIGVAGGEVKGCDVTTGKLQFGWTVYMPKAQFTAAYLKGCGALVGKMNDAEFYTFARGEIEYKGMTFSRRQRQDDFEVSHVFEGSPNVSEITVGEITGIEKLGYDYLWVTYEEAEDEEAEKVVPRPVQVNVERVTRFADFSPLGINL